MPAAMTAWAPRASGSGGIGCSSPNGTAQQRIRLASGTPYAQITASAAYQATNAKVSSPNPRSTIANM